MITDVGMVAVAMISLATAYIISQSQLRNWMKKQNFSLQVQAEKLKLKKLEKDLGLKRGSTAPPQGENKSLTETIAGLDLNKIKELAGLLNKDDTDIDYEDQPSIEGFISDVVQNNPELVQQFLGKLQGGKDGGGSDNYL